MEKIIHLDEGELKKELKDYVRQSVEETLNGLLDQEADQITKASRYERSPDRVDTRAGHYQRKLLTTAGEVELKVPKLRRLPFETAIIERYRRKESSVEESLIEMYLAGVSVRRVEDITEALWGAKVSPSAISALNQKAYVNIEQWRNRPLEGSYPYVYLDGIYLKRSWGGEYQNVSVLVALAVNGDGRREIIGACEGGSEDKESWLSFLRSLKERGLSGTQLFVGDKCLGLLEAIQESFEHAKYQRCVVHFYRNMFTVTPQGKRKAVASMLKAIHAQEDKAAAREKGKAVIEKLRGMKLADAAKKLEAGLEETLTYMDFPREHWTRLRSNNGIERIMKELRRRTRVVGAFPDGQSALMLVCARLRHITQSGWNQKRYIRFEEMEDASMQEMI